MRLTANDNCPGT